MMHNDDATQDQWVNDFRLGLCRAAGFYRKLALTGASLSMVERQGLADLLTQFEDFLLDVEFESATYDTK